MPNLNQQNSQLYICIPQLNTLGHPLEGPMLETIPKHLQRPSASLAPGQNCHQAATSQTC